MSEASEKLSEAVRRLTATVAASDAFANASRLRPTAYPGRITSQDFIEDIRTLLAERTEMREAAQEFVDGLRLIGQNSSLQMSKETRKAIGALMALKLVDLLEPYWRQAGMEMPPRLPPREEP